MSSPPADSGPPAQHTKLETTMSFWTDLRLPCEQELLVGFFDLTGYMRFAEATEPPALLDLMTGFFAVSFRLTPVWSKQCSQNSMPAVCIYLDCLHGRIRCRTQTMRRSSQWPRPPRAHW